MKLDPTAFARRAVEFSRQAAAEASRNASHAERISISDPAREASRGTGRPAQGDVQDVMQRALDEMRVARAQRRAKGDFFERIETPF